MLPVIQSTRGGGKAETVHKKNYRRAVGNPAEKLKSVSSSSAANSDANSGKITYNQKGVNIFFSAAGFFQRPERPDSTQPH
uniref:hypothetical protein n=1 Tax=Candidatus Electronema sp. TaxID=2698783 RepID=UPI00405683D5